MKRGGHTKTMNAYAEELGRLYGKTPKAVFAAIAVSRLTDGGDSLAEAQSLLLAEWRILYENRIVPQRPVRAAEGKQTP